VSKFGLIGASYTAKFNTIADEECINQYAETAETPGAQAKLSYIGTPGLELFCTFTDGPTRGGIEANGRVFEASADTLYEVMADKSFVARMDGVLDTFGAPVSIAASNIQLLIVAGGRAYCYTLATNTYVDVTASLAGVPIKTKYSDGYFIVCFKDSNKFQISDILDGTVWPGIQVNEVSVFAENIVSIEVSHRELWVFGARHAQPYQDTGTDEIFDVAPSGFIETGCAATFSACQLDNTVLWVNEDERGARMCWRANGYTPQRISTHAVEAWLSLWSQDDFANLVSYSYQDGGHLFWLLYIPNSDASFVYDVAEGLWHKRAEWNPVNGKFGPHLSWNHVYAFGKHLVGDYQTGNLYEMKLAYDKGGGVYAFVTDNGATIRRLRRAPTLMNELERIYFPELKLQVAAGLGPQPPLKDGDGNDRPPQIMLRWSDDSGNTWSNEHVRGIGFAGQYQTFVRWQRLGQTRYGRVFELSFSDPVPYSITEGFVRAS